MKVLIACEESQRMCISFRDRGHEAYSCDIIECSGGHPEWHIKGDCLPILNGFCSFTTQDNTTHTIDTKWDLIIAHPPCTDLAVSGARHFARKRADGSQQRSIDFFMEFTKTNCDKVCIENPVCIMSTIWRKPDQIIHPYEFGHPYRKTTCLWLKGLPKLKPTEIVEPELTYYVNKEGKVLSFDGLGCKTRDPKERSKTFWGIARACAEQWG